MNKSALKLYHELMKKGWIERDDNSVLWSFVEDAEVRDELDQMGTELGFEIVPAQNRIYMVPTQDNDLFLKNNIDYRSDIKAGNDVRTRDLYLLNYLAIYILYIFFKGEGTDALVRDFITKEEFIKEFTDHCLSVTQKGVAGENKAEDFSDSFYMLAEDWLGKKEGDPASRRVDDRYGVVNKILLKLRADDLFIERDDGKIEPTKKVKDLMPYVLRKERVQYINAWIEGDEYATDK